MSVLQLLHAAQVSADAPMLLACMLKLLTDQASYKSNSASTLLDFGDVVTAKFRTRLIKSHCWLGTSPKATETPEASSNVTTITRCMKLALKQKQQGLSFLGGY